jgi:hypothetical protein
MQFLTIIRTFSRFSDTYVRLEDSDGDTFVVCANNGNVFIPTRTNIRTIYVMENFTNCCEDLPVTMCFMTRNISALLTTVLIIPPTSRVIKCSLVDRCYDMPTGKQVIKLTGQTVSILNRDDVLCRSIDTNVITNINSVTHFHGMLDGLDVLSAKPEYRDFSENGMTLFALNITPEPL